LTIQNITLEIKLPPPHRHKPVSPPHFSKKWGGVRGEVNINEKYALITM